MAMALFAGMRQQSIEPCQSAEKIVFDHMDEYVPASNQKQADSFIIWATILTSTIKVIEQKQAFSLRSLIGNTGGYIGLLLGIYDM